MRVAQLVLAVVLGTCAALEVRRGATLPRGAATRRGFLTGGVITAAAGVLHVDAASADVVLNPFEALPSAVAEPTDEVPTLAIDEVYALLKKKKIRSVTFVTPNADKGRVTLTDGAVFDIARPPEKSSSTVAQSQGEKLVSKLRDANVPYTFASFNLGRYNQKAMRVVPASKNAGVKVAEALAAEEKQQLEAAAVAAAAPGQ